MSQSHRCILDNRQPNQTEQVTLTAELYCELSVCSLHAIYLQTKNELRERERREHYSAVSVKFKNFVNDFRRE